MSKVKYRVREYNPTSAQQGSHSFFAEAVINNEITNAELADKIAASTAPRLTRLKRDNKQVSACLFLHFLTD